MPTLLVAGAAVLDCVYVMDELPVTAEKYRAKNFALRGGGTAATAAAAKYREFPALVMIKPARGPRLAAGIPAPNVGTK